MLILSQARNFDTRLHPICPMQFISVNCLLVLHTPSYAYNLSAARMLGRLSFL